MRPFKSRIPKSTQVEPRSDSTTTPKANIFDDIYANNELTPDKLDKIKSRFMIGKQASMENLQRPTLASKATSVRGDPRKAK